MKFQELPPNNHFSIDGFPGVMFQKAEKQSKGSCCTPRFNATFTNDKDKQDVMQFKADITITPEDSPPPTKRATTLTPAMKKKVARAMTKRVEKAQVKKHPTKTPQNKPLKKIPRKIPRGRGRESWGN